MSRRQSGRGSKYITVLGRRKRIDAGTVLAATVIGAGIQAASDAANAPLGATEFIEHYLPRNVDIEWIQRNVGVTNHRKAVGELGLRRPATITVYSIFLGGLGIDRFVLGQPIHGLAKLLTIGGCTVWWLADIFTTSSRVRVWNLRVLEKKFKE